MTTPTAEGQPGAGPDRVERIRRRLIWALLLPFCVLMSVAAVEGFSSENASHPGIAITALLLAAFGLPLLLAWLGMSISREVDALEHERDELKRLYGRARHDALVDGLTGLGNHRAFQDELARQLEVSKRMDLPLALLLVDVDDLKVVNDTKGHAGGDRLLEAVGRVTASVLRRGDRAFRVGGDEFAILLPVSDVNTGMEVGRRSSPRPSAAATRPRRSRASRCPSACRPTPTPASRAMTSTATPTRRSTGASATDAPRSSPTTRPPRRRVGGPLGRRAVRRDRQRPRDPRPPAGLPADLLDDDRTAGRL